MNITEQASGDGTLTAQLANRGYELNPRSGMISLDLPEGIWRLVVVTEDVKIGGKMP